MIEATLLPSFIAAASGLLGVIAGGWITHTIQKAGREDDRRYKASGLRQALAAEIEAYIDMVELRKQEQHIETLITINHQLEATAQPNLPRMMISQFERTTPFLPITNSNLSQLGALGPDLSRDVAKFLSRVQGVRSTIASVDDGKYDRLTPQEASQLMTSELEVWRNAKALGRSTVAALRAHSGGTP